MMRFEIEWVDAPGVRDQVLAATWARLALTVQDHCVTELLDLRSSSRRTGVYGSVFPLAEWIVENWWNLLHEPSPVSPVVSARAAMTGMRPFLQRHGLLAARDGAALPDLSFWRDGPEILLHWDADPPSPRESRVRFVGQGHVRLPRESVQAGLTSLVSQVLGRLDALELNDEDSLRLRAAWSAIGASTADEPETCRRLAVLGLNPYDPDEATDELVDLVERVGTVLPSVLADDLLEGSRPAELLTDLAWVEAGTRSLGAAAVIPRFPALGSAAPGTAHHAGYLMARQARSDLLGLDARSPVGDLAAALVDRLAWSPQVEVEQPKDIRTRLDGIVGFSRKTSRPLCIVPSSRTEAATRFRLARAAYLVLSGDAVAGPRLLSAAATRPQRASRAFAAELLVPAAALADRMEGAVSEALVEEVAEEFRVSPLVVKHQIENHRLGTIKG